jgi:hypothetical protein
MSQVYGLSYGGNSLAYPRPHLPYDPPSRIEERRAGYRRLIERRLDQAAQAEAEGFHSLAEVHLARALELEAMAP